MYLLVIISRIGYQCSLQPSRPVLYCSPRAFGYFYDWDTLSIVVLEPLVSFYDWNTLSIVVLEPLAVLRIQDVYPGSRIRLFSIPDPNCLHPGSRVLIKEFKYFNPKKSKKWFLSSKKYCMIWVVHPGSRIRMLTFSHPGSRIQGSKRHPIPDPQHWPLVSFCDWDNLSIVVPEPLVFFLWLKYPLYCMLRAFDCLWSIILVFYKAYFIVGHRSPGSRSPFSTWSTTHAWPVSGSPAFRSSFSLSLRRHPGTPSPPPSPPDCWTPPFCNHQLFAARAAILNNRKNLSNRFTGLVSCHM